MCSLISSFWSMCFFYFIVFIGPLMQGVFSSLQHLIYIYYTYIFVSSSIKVSVNSERFSGKRCKFAHESQWCSKVAGLEVEKLDPMRLNNRCTSANSGMPPHRYAIVFVHRSFIYELMWDSSHGMLDTSQISGCFQSTPTSSELSTTSTICFWGSCHRTRTVVATCTVVMLRIGGGTEFWGHICAIYIQINVSNLMTTLMAKLFLIMFQWCFPSNWPERPVSFV